MMVRSLSVPHFSVDSLPEITDTDTRELLRHIEIRAGASHIFPWLKQLRIAPYSYDFIDNRSRKSPEYIVENLPPLKINTHILLAFHIFQFEENSYIVCRFCEPINSPVNKYFKGLYLEYRLSEQEDSTMLWCKIKSYINRNISSKGFFTVFSVVNRVMMSKQLRKIKKLSEQLAAGEVETGKYDLNGSYSKSGIHWWIFCRRHNCKGLIG